MLNQFSRTELLLGAKAMAKLADSTVAIFGIGGVGSFVAEGLARSGIGHLVLIDNDTICLTNVNRQIHATTQTVGRSKTEVMQERILAINPKAVVDVINDFYLPEKADGFFNTAYDYVVDAIDTVAGKIDLAIQAQRRHIPILSCMGAGNKLDPTRFEVADIYETSVCPLARVMRHELKERGISHLKVVYSQEKPLKRQQSGCGSECICPPGSARNCDRRRAVPGSIAFVPSVAGLIIAGEVVKDLAAEYIQDL
jgi:tRNA A37 threonylcarbamoyladenosine dehydratase